MKPQSTKETKSRGEFDPASGDRSPWANGWHPVWDFEGEPSKTGEQTQWGGPDDRYSADSPQSYETLPAEKHE